MNSFDQERIVNGILERILYMAVHPDPHSRDFNPVWKDVFTGDRFGGTLDQTNTLTLARSSDDVGLYTIKPENLENFLAYSGLETTGGWAIVSPVTFDREAWARWSLMISSYHALTRRMYERRDQAASALDWDRCLKMGLTHDWRSSSVDNFLKGYISLGKCMDFITHICQPTIAPLKWFYKIHLADAKSQYRREGLTPVLGMCMSHDPDEVDVFMRGFQSRWVGGSRELVILDGGVFHAESIEKAYGGLQVFLTDLSKMSNGLVLDSRVTVGLKSWSSDSRRFIYPNEEVIDA